MANIGYANEKAKFFSVLADGKFHHSVPEGTEGAVKREYETSDGKKDFKWDIIADSIEGVMSSISTRDGDFGKQLHIAFAPDEKGKEPVVISLNVSSNFAEDFLKKLKNIEIDKPVKLVPYSFEDDKGKNKRGITVYQGDKKLQSYYHELKKGKDGKEKIVAINDYPEIPKEAKEWESDDWKIFFVQTRKFMLKQLEKHPLYNLAYLKSTEGEVEYPVSNMKDVPF